MKGKGKEDCRHETGDNIMNTENRAIMFLLKRCFKILHRVMEHRGSIRVLSHLRSVCELALPAFHAEVRTANWGTVPCLPQTANEKVSLATVANLALCVAT
jgi:hypothetical protein